MRGRERYHSFTDKEYGHGARLDNGGLVLAKSGRSAVRWRRPVQGPIKTVTVSREADGWYVCFSWAEVPPQPVPLLTGRETGIDVGLKVFLITAAGQSVANPRHDRSAERARKKAPQRASRRKQGSHRLAAAVRVLARTHQQAVRVLARTHQHVRRQRASRLPPHDRAGVGARLRHD